MRTIQIFKFEELSSQAQANAIQEHRWEMQEREGAEALHWALDDCSLWEPPHDEMVALLGHDYHDRNLTPDGKFGQFVFANRRNPLRVDIEYRYLKFGKSLEITNTPMFLTWLGIPEEHHPQVEWELDDTGAYHTELILSMEVDDADTRKDEFMAMLQRGVAKFDDHVQKCIDRLEIGVEEYFSDENVAERLRDTSKEFTSLGKSIEVTIA